MKLFLSTIFAILIAYLGFRFDRNVGFEDRFFAGYLTGVLALGAFLLIFLS